MKPCRVFSLCLTAIGVILAIAACDSRRPTAGITGPTQPSPSPSTTSLSGQVVDVTPAGRFPLADVMVSAVVLPPGGALYQNFSTTTGADGRYSFPQLPLGSAVVHAHSAGRRQVCGALPPLTATTQLDLEVTSSANPERSSNPAPLRVTGQIYEMTPAGRVGLGGAVIYVYLANDGYFLTVVADAEGYYLACGIPANRPLASRSPETSPPAMTATTRFRTSGISSAPTRRATSS